MYKYGVVSIASIAKRFIDGLRLAGDEVVCVGSRDIDKAKKFAEENNITKYYGSYEEVYEDKDVDIVYIPVINYLHYECAKQALCTATLKVDIIYEYIRHISYIM